ncbi:type 4b pilus protein PilO2 [Paraburkholderia sp. BR10872]|uniref:type 4b pilus protein PilO2 n=1 Tax=Paraburkholderia sp. BR10872 TaxID=3236989 RepID=UPI0034D21246
MAELVNLPGIRTPFAAGLSWRHSDAKPTHRELREVALTDGRWGMVRTSASGHFQVGSCDTVEGAKTPKGIRPLAAVVADHHREPWMGLYPLENGRYWYIAVRDGGAVISGGDRIGTFDELMRVRDEHASKMGPWNEVNGTLADLVEMVSATPRQPPLKDLNRHPWLPVAYAGAAVLTLGVGLGIYEYQQASDLEQVRAVRKARAAAADASRKASADAEARILPWTREPMTDEVLDACGRAWAMQPLTRGKGGWALSAWHCVSARNGITINTNWNNVGGLAADAPGQLDISGITSKDTVSLPVAFGSPSAHALGNELARRAVWTLAEQNAITLKLTDAPATPGLPGVVPETAKPWLAMPAQMSLAMPPWTPGLDTQFGDIPGLRVHSIDLVLATGNWAIDSTLYAMRPAGATEAPVAGVGPQAAPRPMRSAHKTKTTEKPA